jgi:hypothetical protein
MVAWRIEENLQVKNMILGNMEGRNENKIK